MDRKELLEKLTFTVSQQDGLNREVKALQEKIEKLRLIAVQRHEEAAALYRELKGHFEPEEGGAETVTVTELTHPPRMRILQLLQQTGQKLGATHITKACGLAPRKAGPHFSALARAGLIRKTEDHKWVAA